MSCLYPRRGYPSAIVNPSGKRSTVFKKILSFPGAESFPVPCSQCMPCRLGQAAEQAIRCVHEASLYEYNQYLTLTYNNKYLPKTQSIDHEDIVLFMKRLRRNLPDQKIRSYGAAEYGAVYDLEKDPQRKSPLKDKLGRQLLGRPHYHLLLFNTQLEDQEPWRIIRGYQYQQSQLISKLWSEHEDGNSSKGFHSLSDVTIKSAGYVARYVTKKYTNQCKKKVKQRYKKRLPERAVAVSKGLGRGWLEAYKSDVYPMDEIIHQSKRFKPPKYYDYRHAIDEPEEMQQIKEKRKIAAKRASQRPQPPLASKIIHAKRVNNLLKRGLEQDDVA